MACPGSLGFPSWALVRLVSHWDELHFAFQETSRFAARCLVPLQNLSFWPVRRGVAQLGLCPDLWWPCASSRTVGHSSGLM